MVGVTKAGVIVIVCGADVTKHAPVPHDTV
jgi:hypothetical protein